MEPLQFSWGRLVIGIDSRRISGTTRPNAHLLVSQQTATIP